MTRSVVVWRSAQWAGVLVTLVLLAGLAIQPDLTLRILWYAVVPALPLVFVLQPTIWRNVCPLAAFNLLGAHVARPPVRRLADAKWAAALGIVLLFALVPARRFLFNTDGLALMGVI